MDRCLLSSDILLISRNLSQTTIIHNEVIIKILWCWWIYTKAVFIIPSSKTIMCGDCGHPCFWLVPYPLWSTKRLYIIGSFALHFVYWWPTISCSYHLPWRFLWMMLPFIALQLPQLDLRCSTWQMRLNPSKCEFLCISDKLSPIHHSYYLDNHLLQCV